MVTAFEFELHPMQREVVAGRIMFPVSRAEEVLKRYAEYAATAPETLQADAVVMYPPGGADGLAGVEVCYSGSQTGAERALAPLYAAGTPVQDTVAAQDYVWVQRSGDTDDPRARASYLYGGFVPEIPDDLIRAALDGLVGDPGRSSMVAFVQAGGAIGRAAPDATAFSQRDAVANLLCSVGWRHGDDPDAHVRHIQGFWPSLERYTHGFYVNDMSPGDTASRIRESYQRNHERLVQVKNRYDPTNLFRLNANIRPTV